MTGWMLLAAAIVLEVCATLSLRMAVHGSRWWYAAVGAGYVSSYTALSLSLRAGMLLGVAYGIWTAVGVVLVAIAGRVLFREQFTWVMGLGVALIAGGVLLVEFGHG